MKPVCVVFALVVVLVHADSISLDPLDDAISEAVTEERLPTITGGTEKDSSSKATDKSENIVPASSSDMTSEVTDNTQKGRDEQTQDKSEQAALVQTSSSDTTSEVTEKTQKGHAEQAQDKSKEAALIPTSSSDTTSEVTEKTQKGHDEQAQKSQASEAQAKSKAQESKESKDKAWEQINAGVQAHNQGADAAGDAGNKANVDEAERGAKDAKKNHEIGAKHVASSKQHEYNSKEAQSKAKIHSINSQNPWPQPSNN